MVSNLSKVIANMVFGSPYVGIGVEHLHGAETDMALDHFLSAFFVSA
jgi:hypothetical protein